MKRLLPGRTEVAILATLALICGTIVAASEVKDLWLAMLAIPVFITAGLMGMRRHPIFGGVPRKSTSEQSEDEELIEQSN